MKNEEHEQYEYARKRVKQKKRFYYHLILFLVGSFSMFIANTYLNVAPDTKWYLWTIATWSFLLILHFVKVFITDLFMGKEWERAQINKLVKKQEERRNQLDKEIANTNFEQQ